MLRTARVGAVLQPFTQRWCQGFHTTLAARGLEDFFDTPRKEDERPTAGRSWKAAELRLKSWDDLHKLWYVLLKERNMLQSETLAAFSERKALQNPFRIRKVKVSMARLKLVLWERALEEKGARTRMQLKQFMYQADVADARQQPPMRQLAPAVMKEDESGRDAQANLCWDVQCDDHHAMRQARNLAAAHGNDKK